MLHETCIMPDLAGLPALLAMIFAPSLTVKRSKDKTRYSLIKVGLGATGPTRVPLFHENDFTVPVNIKLTEDDLKEVNHLRFLLSNLLGPKHIIHIDETKRIEQLRKVKELTMKILLKKRTLLDQMSISEAKDKTWKLDAFTPVEENHQLYPGFWFPPLEKMKKETAEKIAEECAEYERRFLR